MVSKIISEGHRYQLHQLSRSETIFKVCYILSKHLFPSKNVILCENLRTMFNKQYTVNIQFIKFVTVFGCDVKECYASVFVSD